MVEAIDEALSLWRSSERRVRFHGGPLDGQTLVTETFPGANYSAFFPNDATGRARESLYRHFTRVVDDMPNYVFVGFAS